MEPVPLNALPKYSDWAAYLLDPSGEPPSDSTAYIGTETYEEIYARLLESYRDHPLSPIDAVKQIRSHGRSDGDLVSEDRTLYRVGVAELVEREYDTVQTALEPLLEGDETVLDLGCGWGWTLDAIASKFPGVRVVGGEYVPDGVEFARKVFVDGRDRERIAVDQFDFFGDWEIVDVVDGNCVVFTKGTLVTLSETESVVERLETLAAERSVTAGVHLEQVGPHPETVLGHLRRRYSRERGYDDAVLDHLRNSPELDVIDVTYDVHGSNPLHPLTRIRWQAR